MGQTRRHNLLSPAPKLGWQVDLTGCAKDNG